MPDEDTISYEEIQLAVPRRIGAMLAAFEFSHLPPELQMISKPFADLAHTHAAALAHVDGPSAVHLEHGMERLLEAKDAFVRAALTVLVRPSA